MDSLSSDEWQGWEDVCSVARPLSEVIDSTAQNGSLDANEFSEFVDEWADALKGAENLQTRLGLDGIDIEDVRDRLVSSSIPDDHSNPDWMECVKLVVERASDLEPELYDELIEANQQRPFVHVTAPLVRAASARVDFPTTFTTTAVTDLEHWLLSRLTNLCQHALFIQYKAFSDVTGPTQDPSPTSTETYESFVNAVRKDGLRGLFGTYPVLARYIGTVIRQWEDAVRELSDRVVADRRALTEHFGDGEALGSVTDVDTLSDDPHGEGRLVLSLTFDSGTTVVYKPRSVGSAVAFDRIIQWANNHVDIPDMFAPATIDRTTYGWMEFVPAGSCQGTIDAERYYERAGALMALVYVLGGTDFHHENVIAYGEHPVLVDLETVLSPGDPVAKLPDSEPWASNYRRTVLETMMLPVVQEGFGTDRMVAGLVEPNIERMFGHQPVFTDVNTDAMDLEFTREADSTGQNLPMVDGEIQPPESYLDALKDGFETTIRTIMKERSSFVTTLAEAFRDCTIRFLYRPTFIYGRILQQNGFSSHLRSGLQTGLENETLCRPFVEGYVSEPTHWSLVASERHAIERRDIPRFTLKADDRTVHFDGNPVSEVESSPLERARQRVGRLDPTALETQLSLIELPFATTEITAPASAPGAVDAGPIAKASSTEAVVTNVVDVVRRTVMPRPEGGLTWPDVSGPRLAGAVRFASPGYDLYDGAAGVGLFLAAVAAVRDDATVRGLAIRVLQPVVDAVNSEEGVDDLEPGGVTGIGSVVYGLCRAGTLLEESTLIDAAENAGEALTRDTIEADDQYGIVDGSAGELLANLVLYEETGNETALTRAGWCGDHLLANREESETGHHVWCGADFSQPLTGFSHGAAGIGYALGRLGEITGREAFLEGAADAIGFESALYERDNGWIDRRKDVPGELDAKGGWCHGRPGIGVSRLGIQSDVGSLDGSEDLYRAVEGRLIELSFEDSLCCGTAGRICFLQEAGAVLGDEAVSRAGSELLERVRSRAKSEGWSRLKGHTAGLPRLSLFNGLAGVGYVALRETAGPGVLPNVTRLE